VITLQYSTSLAWQSTLIRRFSHSPFSHVDLVLPDGNLLGASDSPDAPSIRGNPRGVAVRPAEYQPFGIRRWAVIRTTKKHEDIFYPWIEAQIGKPFDSGAMHALIGEPEFNIRDWRDPEMWYCSEMLVAGFDFSGLFPYELVTPKNRVSPGDSLLILNPYIESIKDLYQPIPGIKLGPKER
jgi:hypothetical protein